jgi:hypothetical protein
LLEPSNVERKDDFMDDELERILMEAVVPCFKVLSQQLPGGNEDNHEIPVSGM